MLGTGGLCGGGIQAGFLVVLGGSGTGIRTVVGGGLGVVVVVVVVVVFVGSYKKGVLQLILKQDSFKESYK